MTEPALQIYVIAGGEYFQQFFNAIASFFSSKDFPSLMRISALFGIIAATVVFVKRRDPSVYIHWVIAYVLVGTAIFIPKEPVSIYDISRQKSIVVANVPVIISLPLHFITVAGHGLAMVFDSLLSLPDDEQYTKAGALFGSRLIQAARDFRITSPDLKEEMRAYFRNCVVGDIRLNHKYSVADLAASQNIWATVSANPSPIRMTPINGKLYPCAGDNNKTGATDLLKAKLDKEIERSYRIFGMPIFGQQKAEENNNAPYKLLFENHLASAYNYYQNLSDSSSNIFLQSMMINALRDGVADYQANTDSSAGLINQQFTKTQVQHRWSWQVLGKQAMWMLPILQTILMAILIGCSPLIVLLGTLPGGGKIFIYTLQFLASLQFWPVAYAALNFCMTMYLKSSSPGYGGFSMINLDQIDELHQDISGVAGYFMMMIPFLAYGLVTNIGQAFSNLATGITNHMQGSTMGIAGEAASGSFAIGQTSFYNTTANNLSANKHDSNFSNLHGMRTEQFSSGVLKTLTGSGDTVYDVSPGMSKSGVSIVDAKGLSGSLSQAYERSTQTAAHEAQQFQSALSNASHHALSLSKLAGHDMRLGSGVSSGDSAQYTDALNTLNSISKEYAQRHGISQDDAFTRLGSLSLESSLGFDNKLFSAKTTAKGELSKAVADRTQQDFNNSVSARDQSDFSNALNYVKNFTTSHHFDNSHSEAAQLSNQLGADLRSADTASHNYDASITRASRIQSAQSFVETHSDQINADLNQAFQRYVHNRVGGEHADALYANPGDMGAIAGLQSMGGDFLEHKREELISQYGNAAGGAQIQSSFEQAVKSLPQNQAGLTRDFHHNNTELENSAKNMGVNLPQGEVNQLQNNVRNQIHSANNHIAAGSGIVQGKQLEAKVQNEIRIPEER